MSNFFDCATKDLTLDQVFSMLLTKNAEGETALRTMIVPACAESAIDCSTNSIPVNAQIMQMIGVNDCGKPAVRLGLTVVAMVAALGVESFANDAAAGVGGIAIGGVYFNTTTNTLVSRLV